MQALTFSHTRQADLSHDGVLRLAEDAPVEDAPVGGAPSAAQQLLPL